LKRQQITKTGIKFFVETKGVGKKLAVASIVLQLSLGMALIKINVLIVDFMMLCIFPSKSFMFLISIEREIYAREKFMKTEDFSEFDLRRR